MQHDKTPSHLSAKGSCSASLIHARPAPTLHTLTAIRGGGHGVKSSPITWEYAGLMGRGWVWLLDTKAGHCKKSRALSHNPLCSHLSSKPSCLKEKWAPALRVVDTPGRSSMLASTEKSLRTLSILSLGASRGKPSAAQGETKVIIAATEWGVEMDEGTPCRPRRPHGMLAGGGDLKRS